MDQNAPCLLPPLILSPLHLSPWRPGATAIHLRQSGKSSALACRAARPALVGGRDSAPLKITRSCTLQRIPDELAAEIGTKEAFDIAPSCGSILRKGQALARRGWAERRRRVLGVRVAVIRGSVRCCWGQAPIFPLHRKLGGT